MGNSFIKRYKKYGLEKALLFLRGNYYKIKVTPSDIAEFIKFLAQNGENINDPEIAEGILHHGTYPDGFYPEVFAAFVEAGGDINVRDRGGNSPLICYISRLSDLSLGEVTELLVNTDKFYEAIKLFLDLGADPNNIGYRSVDGKTRELSLIGQIICTIEDIYDGVSKQYLPDGLAGKIVRLIELAASYEADMNIPGYSGKTPLHHATSPEVVSALLRCGADPNAKDLLLESALQLNYGKAKLLLDAGAEIKNLGNSENAYPTLLFVLINKIIYRWRAVSSGEQDTVNETIESFVDLLVKYGIDMEVKNCRGETAFAFACDWRGSKHQKTILTERIDIFLKTLAAAGANIYALTKDGKPAVELLQENFQKELIKLAEYRDTVRAADDTDLDLYER